MSSDKPRKGQHKIYRDHILGPRGVDLAELIPDRREFATDADRQAAIRAHRKRIARELRRRRR